MSQTTAIEAKGVHGHGLEALTTTATGWRAFALATPYPLTWMPA